MKKIFLLLCLLSSFVTKGQWQQITADTQDFLNVSINDTVIYGTAYNKVCRSIDGGNVWVYGNNGLSDTLLTSILNAGTDIFVGNFVGEVFRSNDNGNSWTFSGTVVPDHQIIFLSKHSSNMYASVDSVGLFISNNNGNTWSPINNGLTTTQINAFAVSGTDIIIGTDSGAFISANNGGLWTSINSGLNSIHVYSLAVSGPNIFAGTDDGVFIFNNNSGLWTAANSGINGIRIFSLATNGLNIFACGSLWQTPYGGVYMSNDGGNSWVTITTGMPYFNAFSLAITSTDIYALMWEATPAPSTALWKQSLSEVVGINEINNSNQLTIYPNPSTGKFRLKNSELKVQNLKIYNSFGENVFQFSGNYQPLEDEIDLSSLPKGVYFVNVYDEHTLFDKRIIIQ